MSLSDILGGFESLHNHFFFQIFGAKEKIGNFAKKVGKNRYNQNFGEDILSISTDNRNFTDISVKILYPARE